MGKMAKNGMKFTAGIFLGQNSRGGGGAYRRNKLIFWVVGGGGLPLGETLAVTW